MNGTQLTIRLEGVGVVEAGLRRRITKLKEKIIALENRLDEAEAQKDEAVAQKEEAIEACKEAQAVGCISHLAIA